MRTTTRRLWVLVVALAALCSDLAAATPGTCARQRALPNQDLLWACVTEDDGCGAGNACQTIGYSGSVTYSTCECLPLTPSPDDYSYGTGAVWIATILAGVPGPGASVDFQLVPGPNALVVYANVDVDQGTITGAQELTGAGDFSGTFTVEFGSTPLDSIPVHISALALSMASWSFEGMPTGTTSITLAADGPLATGFYDVATSTIQFDAPVHCIATNDLHLAAEFYFRPILAEVGDQKPGARLTQNPFRVLGTGRYEPPGTVGVMREPWGRIKALYR